MGRDIRYFPPGTLVEVTMVTIQNRYLLRPSPQLNDIVLGIFGRAQRLFDMTICGLVVLSTHYHALLVPRDPQHLADFQAFVNCNLSKEVGRLHDWPGKMWHGRYQLVPASDEDGAQIGRLKYLLAAGVKEFLVDRVTDWPGVHSAATLINGSPLVGKWYDRTQEYEARQLRGEEDVDPESYASEEQIVLSPLPCWQHLPPEIWRRRVAELVATIDEEGARERERTGKTSLGPGKVRRVPPRSRPNRIEKSPRPKYHAVTRAAFKRWREAYREIVAAFREAFKRLLAGELSVAFPEGTFPPGQGFIPFTQIPVASTRGQPV